MINIIARTRYNRPIEAPLFNLSFLYFLYYRIFYITEIFCQLKPPNLKVALVYKYKKFLTDKGDLKFGGFLFFC